MLIIRPTASLAKKMKIKLAGSHENSNTVLGDWFATDVHACRQQMILCTSKKSRLAVVCKAAPYASWPDRFIENLSHLLLQIGISKAQIANELSKMSNSTFAKTNSPSILGTINDQKKHIEFMLSYGRIALDDHIGLSHSLAEVPILVLPGTFPFDVAKKLFESTTPKHLSLVTSN